MAENRTPTKRTDVIRCENCGEDYSVTYKRCPFCDELRHDQQRASSGRSTRSSGTGGKRMATNTRGGGYGRGGDFNILRIIGIVVPLALIVAAIYIIITVLGPMITAGHGVDPNASDTATVNTDSPAPSDSASGEPQPSDDPVVVTPVPSGVTAITLDKSDFTLPANGSYKISATLTPADASATVTWSADKPQALSIGQDGTVTNTNTGSSSVTVTVTASCGDVSATCLVRCKGGSGGSTASPAPSPSASTAPGGTVNTGSAVISNAGAGLRVRSGPGTTYDILASLVNGNKVTVVENAGGGWYKITFDGAGGAKVTGYVLGDYLTNR